MKRHIDLHGEWHERPPDTPAEWRLGGYGLIEREGRLLMVQPVFTTEWTWGLPGGGIRLMPEETILEGIAREVYEETGYRFAPDPATLIHTGDVFFRTRRGRYLRHITFVARGKIPDEPDPAWSRPEDEIVRVAWVDPRRCGVGRSTGTTGRSSSAWVSSRELRRHESSRSAATTNPGHYQTALRDRAGLPGSRGA